MYVIIKVKKGSVGMENNIESVYIHIPFCKSICSYCDFCKVLYYGPWVTQYINALVEEIKDKYNGDLIKTLYIGGGTPSALQEKDLRYLLDVVKRFNLANEIEFTFECNLNDINETLLDVLKEYGVNRLSIGIESFNEEKLKFMERHHTYEEAESAMKLCRAKGFDNINVDFIYGIPGESLKDMKKDFDLLLKLNPDHISTYSLIIEDNTKIGITKMVPIPEELDASMYEHICDKLESKKYVHYEISNFAKPGKESKHNLHYWNNEEYYGFGVGASGYTFGVRYDNTKSINSYLKGNYLYYTHQLDLQEMIENEFILGLRKISGINKDAFFKKYRKDINDYKSVKKMLTNNKLVDDGKNIYINRNFLCLSNDILVEFLN